MVGASYPGTSVTISRSAQSHVPQDFIPHQHRLEELKYRRHASGTKGKYAYKPTANGQCLRFALVVVNRTYHGMQFHAEPIITVCQTGSSDLTSQYGAVECVKVVYVKRAIT